MVLSNKLRNELVDLQYEKKLQLDKYSVEQLLNHNGIDNININDIVVYKSDKVGGERIGELSGFDGAACQTKI